MSNVSKNNGREKGQLAAPFFCGGNAAFRARPHGAGDKARLAAGTARGIKPDSQRVAAYNNKPSPQRTAREKIYYRG